MFAISPPSYEQEDEWMECCMSLPHGVTHSDTNITSTASEQHWRKKTKVHSHQPFY